MGWLSGKVAIITGGAAAEFGGFGIRVNSVRPGGVMTNLFAGLDESVRGSLTSELAIKRMASPEEVTNLVLFLASDEIVLLHSC